MRGIIAASEGRPSTALLDMTTTINGRTFELTENTEELANLRAHIKSQGFDGTIWEGFSACSGR